MKRFVATLLVLCGLLVAGWANATATMTFNQVGSNVEASITGSINLAGLGARSSTQYRAVVQGNIAQAGVGTNANFVDAYAYTSNISGTAAFGAGSSAIAASSGTGGPFTIIGLPSFGPKTLYVPRTYATGTTISGVTSTWNNKTIATLGLTPGTYVYTLGTGGNTDTLTIQINSPPVAPTVTSISPTSGSTAGGDTITITGTDLTGASGITVGGVACSAFNVASATSATCTTPAGAAGTASVVVTTGGGSNAANSLFTYFAPVDCVVSSWSAYGACSASCGGGTQTQTRTIVTPASNGGAACPSLSQSQACNVQACQSQASGTAPGGSGAINAAIGSGGSFIFTQFTTPTNPPAGQSFPYGVFGFTAATNTLGGSITITLTYPQALAAGTTVWKDLTGNGNWVDWTSNVTISGNTITYTIADGGSGDSDGTVDQSITDPIGPALPATSIPSLSEWSQMLLALMVLTMIGRHFHRQRSY